MALELGRDKSDLLKRAHKLGFHSWRRPDGGFYIDSRGYAVSGFDKGKPILVHRMVMENHLGRKLNSNEIVHHIDLNKMNNDIDNLYLCSASEHLTAHISLNRLEKKENQELKIRSGEIRFDKRGGIYKRFTETRENCPGVAQDGAV